MIIPTKTWVAFWASIALITAGLVAATTRPEPHAAAALLTAGIAVLVYGYAVGIVANARECRRGGYE